MQETDPGWVLILKGTLEAKRGKREYTQKPTFDLQSASNTKNYVWIEENPLGNL
jgi:hypothetical protein